MGAALFAPTLLKSAAFDSAPAIAHVAFVKTTDRAAGIKRAINLIGLNKFSGKDLFIKPNFNSSDPTPGSTHEDTLVAILRQLKAMGAGPLTIGDRSGMGDTRAVMTKKSAFQIGKELDAKVVVFDELGADDWELIKFQDSLGNRALLCHVRCARPEASSRPAALRPTATAVTSPCRSRTPWGLPQSMFPAIHTTSCASCTLPPTSAA